jgi:isoleucyl-tRNA synthetase
MTEYKETLNLGKTAFPMKASLAQREPARLEQWQAQDIYRRLREHCHGRPKFILHDGPPYANGHIHLGHAVNKILKDIVCKSKTLSGYDAPYVPGWDCHGLPIELNVEKKLGKAGVNVTADQFREKCREYARTQVDTQAAEFQRLGVFGDWSHPYLTMDYSYEANIIRALGRIIQNGHLQQGVKPVHWCMDCQSALAEAEVEYADKSSFSIDVRFTVLDDAALIGALSHAPDGGGEGPISVPIWTTTPWTLPANQAVAVHPELEYALVQCRRDGHTERFLLAQSLIDDVMARYEITDYRVVAYGVGADCDGIRLQHPFYDREVPIILGEHVTVDVGTGAVHTAPSHGPDDYQVGMKYHLPVDCPVGGNGCYHKDVPLFAGEHVLKANPKIIEVLEAKGNLLQASKMDHSYPHCWRHKTPVIFRATPQWFISMDKQGLRRDAVEAIFNVEWLPSWGKARIAGMIEGRPDWCISRQRAWGTPITLFIHKETQALHPQTPALIEEVAKRVEQGGIEAWFALSVDELLGPDANDYEKVTDTLDVWFDSGVSHSAVLKVRSDLDYPANIYLEGSDQHRGWFQSALLTAVAIDKTVPYQQALTHGFTVDADGRKMSKSLGNVIAPEKVMKTLGADILRLWVAATDYSGELSVSDEILKRVSDAYRRIRNTARFLLANLSDFDPDKDSLTFKDCLPLDRWAMRRCAALQKDIEDAFDKYQFHVIYQKIHNFCANDMGGFYLDIIKDRQYTAFKDSVARRSCQTAMFHIAHALVRWLAPILSFTAEEIWQHIPGKSADSVFFTTWYQALPKDLEEDDFDNGFWQQIIDVRNAVNKELEAARAAGDIGSGLEAQVRLFANGALKQNLDKLQNELRFVLITSEAAVDDFANKNGEAKQTELDDLAVQVIKSAAPKCERCWHRREDVGSDAKHPSICARCVTNIESDGGEKRSFA